MSILIHLLFDHLFHCLECCVKRLEQDWIDAIQILIIIIIFIIIIIIIIIIIAISIITVFAAVLFVHQPGANHAPRASVTRVKHSLHTLSTFLRIRADPSMQIF